MDTPTALLVAGLLILFLTLGLGVWNMTRTTPEPEPKPEEPEKVKEFRRRHPHLTDGFSHSRHRRDFFGGRDPFSPEAQAERERKFNFHFWLILPGFVGFVLAGIGGVWLIINAVAGS